MNRVRLLTILFLIPTMASAAQKISAPEKDDIAQLAKQRAVVERYLSPESISNYKTSAGKLGLLRALLSQGIFKKEQTFELQCMGVVFGDVFVQELGMQWIVVADEYGRDPALRLPNTDIIIYPLTMISKRVEQGEKVDVFDMFNGVAAKIDELNKSKHG
jgi:hypothetical protein